MRRYSYEAPSQMETEAERGLCSLREAWWDSRKRGGTGACASRARLFSSARTAAWGRASFLRGHRLQDFLPGDDITASGVRSGRWRKSKRNPNLVLSPLIPLEDKETS